MLEVDRIHEDTQALPSADKTRDQSDHMHQSPYLVGMMLNNHPPNNVSINVIFILL